MGGRRAHRVAMTVTGGAPIFELAVPCEVFGLKRLDLADPWYDFRLCAAEPGPLRTAAGLSLQAEHDLAELAHADTIIVGAPSAARRLDTPSALIDALRAAHDRGARIASICGGVYALAAAGLLDGRRATTHWMYAEEFTRLFPAVKVDPDVLYVDDGQILTSAGTGAAIDLCLHIVERDLGAAVSNTVARRMVVPPHRDGGQAQYVPASLKATTHDGLGHVLDWARLNAGQPLTIADLAREARLGQRTFVRRFAEATGMSPLRWLTAERIRLAQQLLEATDEPVERIARRTGFGTAPNFRQHFRRATTVSPQTYRKVFRAGRR